MKTILVIANYFDGLYIFRKRLLLELAKKYKVICCVPYDKNFNKFEDENISFIFIDINRRGKNPLQDLKLFYTYLKVIKKVKPIKVITYTIKPNIYGGLAAKLMKVDYYCNITGLGSAFQKKLSRNVLSKMYKLSLSKCKYVFFENEGDKNLFIRLGIISNYNAVKLNGAGVDLNEFTFEPYPNNPIPVFLFIGRAMIDKGYQEYSIAAEQISKIKKVKFIAIGDVEKEFEPTFENIQKQNVIKHYGKVSNPNIYIKNASCIILPSYHEGMSNALLEAGATGRPIITTNIFGCKEAVIDSVSGFLVKVKDSADLTEKIIKFCDLSFEQQQQMALQSYQHISQKFDKEKVVQTTLEYLYK